MNNNVNTRGNQYKLYQNQSRLDIRKYFFTNRVVTAWKSLPDYVVTVKKHCFFKKHLDKFWSNQSIYFNFEPELEGTESRSHSVNVQFDVEKEAQPASTTSISPSLLFMSDIYIDDDYNDDAIMNV